MPHAAVRRARTSDVAASQHHDATSQRRKRVRNALRADGATQERGKEWMRGQHLGTREWVLRALRPCDMDSSDRRPVPREPLRESSPTLPANTDGMPPSVSIDESSPIVRRDTFR